MNRILLGIFAATLILASTPEAYANPYRRTPKVSARQVRQHSRIQQGVRTGTITPEERAALRQDQIAIQQEKLAARSGGVTRSERAQLRHDQNQASQDIYSNKHD